LRAPRSAERFIIRLVRGETRELIILVWPTRATEIEPRELAGVTTTVVAVLAEARVQLRLIRKAEREG
jgi:hypothetical protein